MRNGCVQFAFQGGTVRHHLEKSHVVADVGKRLQVAQAFAHLQLYGVVGGEPGLQPRAQLVDADALGLGLFAGFFPQLVKGRKNEQAAPLQGRVDEHAVKVGRVFAHQFDNLVQNRLGKAHFDLADHPPIPDLAPLGHDPPDLGVLLNSRAELPLFLSQPGL